MCNIHLKKKSPTINEHSNQHVQWMSIPTYTGTEKFCFEIWEICTYAIKEDRRIINTIPGISMKCLYLLIKKMLSTNIISNSWCILRRSQLLFSISLLYFNKLTIPWKLSGQKASSPHAVTKSAKYKTSWGSSIGIVKLENQAKMLQT